MNLKEVIQSHKDFLDSEGRKGSRAIFDGWDMKGVDLTSVNLSHASFRGTDLRHVKAQRTYFDFADLDGADLRDGDFRVCDFNGAKLSNANMKRTKLIGANLINADICGASLDGANLIHAIGYYCFGPTPASGRIVHAVWHEKPILDGEWLVNAGCWWGTLDELEKVVQSTHKCPMYLANIGFLRQYNPAKQTYSPFISENDFNDY